MADANVSFYSLYGLTIQVRWEGEEVEDEIEQLFNPFPFTKQSGINNPIHINLQFTTTEIPTNVPDAASELLSCYDVSIYKAGDFVYITDGYSMFQLHPHEGAGLVTIHHSFKEKPPISKYNLFLIGLVHLLSPRGLYDLHAAGLVRDGAGYLLLGESCSGKSSIALSLIRQGWHYISDDSLLIKSSTDEVVVLSFRRKFYIDPILKYHYPEIAPHLEESTNGADTKRFLDLESVYPNQFYQTGLPKVLIYTSIVPKPESMLVPIDQTYALIKLMEQSASIFFNLQAVKVHLEILKRLVSQTDSYQLLAGRDLYEKPERIAGVISEIMPKVI